MTETRLQRIGHELRQAGFDVPGMAPPKKNTPDDVPPEYHHHIAAESDARNAIHLRSWQLEHAGDPALTVRQIPQHHGLSH